jgi:hypothetical protein
MPRASKSRSCASAICSLLIRCSAAKYIFKSSNVYHAADECGEPANQIRRITWIGRFEVESNSSNCIRSPGLSLSNDAPSNIDWWKYSSSPLSVSTNPPPTAVSTVVMAPHNTFPDPFAFEFTSVSLRSFSQPSTITVVMPGKLLRYDFAAGIGWPLPNLNQQNPNLWPQLFDLDSPRT